MTGLIFLGIALWLLPAPSFAVKSYRWNRDTKDREQAHALTLVGSCGDLLASDDAVLGRGLTPQRPDLAG